ncbi:tryptophan halogenase family protein [Salinimonas sediminis]|uniref:Tryptophan 7-halogenase n=1 Tax=Salinimonas sediminis TaxID=2303538 RepID=A0A346NJ49_9ALTE|nr:tryptophan halogenase family protein [Salinimonas sediminis]AXR05556.1 tryptophan 7-halogenase [Salinimonas sediminis]
MTPHPNEQKCAVVIAGGGTAGWLTAFSLVSRLGPLLDITLIESDAIGTVGVGEATIPTMRTFHRLLGIDEKEFMAQTQATFKLGIQFDNWANQGDRYIHSFGEIGQRSWMAEFHEFWLEAKAQGFGGELSDYCLELQAAQAQKFCLEVDKRPVNYAYHLNATAYAAYLRKKAEGAGVKRIEGKIAHTALDAVSGNIEAVQLEGGRLVEGDFFIDCTGFHGLLIGKALGVGYEDWSHWLAADRAVAVQTELTSAPVPYTKSIAHPAGWQWQIPLQHRMGNGLVYSSRFMDAQQAQDVLLDNLPGAPVADVRHLAFKTGRRHKAWHKNCVAIGLSSGFLEPLESTSIHLITTAILRLMKLFPFGNEYTQQAARFNAETSFEVEAVRDFIILHYHATQRTDSDFWNFYRMLDIPDSLRHRMQLFSENAYVWPDEVGLFRTDSWVQVMLGQGLYPKQHHGAGRLLDQHGLEQQLANIRQAIQKMVTKMPQHHDFITQYCATDGWER